MTRTDIEAVIAKLPAFGDCGVHTPSGRLAEEQERLLNSSSSCFRACGWLQKMAKVKACEVSSYSLKHDAEPHIGYVTNGAFIAAAVHLGFDYKLIIVAGARHQSPNLLLGVSKKSINAFHRRAERW